MTSRHLPSLAWSTALAATLLATGCSSLSGDKIDYKASGSKTVKLDVPPDLSQLPGQTRYGQVSAGAVSANSLNAAQATTAEQLDPVAPTTQGKVTLERQGQTRWLAVALPPEQIWEDVRAFWTDLGFEFSIDQREAGILETTWAENRSKVGDDGIRGLFGRVFDALYDSGLRDRYRTRIERTAKGCEIYITHQGLSEEYVDTKKDQTTWRARPSDPNLEAEMLSRLMARLGASKQQVAVAKKEATAPAAAATSAPAQARLDAAGTTLSVDSDFDTTWRRVGLALDRSGFTVENRDRKQGFYEVRLSDGDPEAKKPGFFASLFSSSKASTTTSADGLSRFRVQVQGLSRSNAQVVVTNEQGKPTNEATAKRIASLLLNELR